MLHRARQLLVRQRTMLSNALRGHLAELGIVSAKGRNGTGELLRIIADGADSYRDRIHRQEHHSPAPRVCGEPTAAEIPGIGPVTLSSGRSLAAWSG
jgi:transposase